MNEEFKKGDRVKIIVTGQTGTVKTLLGNGAIVERDGDEERRFTSVQFNHLEKLDK